MEMRLINERKRFGIGFEKKIERVVDRHFGNDVDGDLERTRFFRKHESGHVIGKRVLLPIAEMFAGLNALTVRNDARAAMRRGAQSHDLGTELDRTVVAVMRDVIKRDVEGHDKSIGLTRWGMMTASKGCARQLILDGYFCAAMVANPRR
jgi:hypothetical protein